MHGIPATAFFSSQQLRKCQTIITDREARQPVFVEFTGFPWDQKRGRHLAIA